MQKKCKKKHVVAFFVSFFFVVLVLLFAQTTRFNFSRVVDFFVDYDIIDFFVNYFHSEILG